VAASLGLTTNQAEITLEKEKGCSIEQPFSIGVVKRL
jgi:hypothetical protein